jgi:hypothetical protein
MNAAFKVSGGGGNRRKVTCVAVGTMVSVTDYADDLFIYTPETEAARETEGEAAHELGVFDDGGNEIMSYDEWLIAEATGVGKLGFDGDYNTIYVAGVNGLGVAEIRNIADNFPVHMPEVLVEWSDGNEDVCRAAWIGAAKKRGDWAGLLDALEQGWDYRLGCDAPPVAV